MTLILDDLNTRGIDTRRVSGTNGGEYHGPCPQCGGRDRFHVWPEQGEAGSWWCRGCGKGGDAIQYLKDFCGKTFREAAAAVGRNLDDLPLVSVTPRQRKKPEFSPSDHQPPNEKWREKAGALVAWAHQRLLENPEQMKYLAGRGIPESAVLRCRIGYNPGEKGNPAIYRARIAWGLPAEMRNGKLRPLWIPRGIVIPLIIDDVVYRIRIRREKADMTPEFQLPYYVLPGSSAATMVIGNDCRAFAVIEAELDAVACAEAAGDICSMVAVGSSSTKPDAKATASMKQALCILNVLDFDVAGAKAAGWWSKEFVRTRRWPVPAGKDPGEAFERGVNLRAWILAGLPPVFRMACSADLAGDHEKRVKQQPEEVEVENVDAVELPGNIRQVAEWFSLHPVRIVKNGKRIRFLSDNRWSANHPEISRRINLAVFMDPMVFDYVLNHPARVIDRRNFIIGN